MTIVDAHHHLWDTRVLHYTLFDSVPALRRPYLLTDYERLATVNCINCSVCVEAASAGADGWRETLWLLEQIKQCRVVQRLIAWAPIEQAGLGGYLQRLTDVGGSVIAGVRRSFEFEAPDFPEQPQVVAGAQLVSTFGYLLELVLFERSLPSVVRLVSKCPDTIFILDHAGKPQIKNHCEKPWRDCIERLANMPNVFCKISGLSTEADRKVWTKEDLKPYIDQSIQAFGWDRVIFGSDWPVCNLAGGFDAWLHAALWATRGGAEADRVKLFSENAEKVYGLAR